MIQDIFLFQHLSKKQMADVVRVMSREQVRKGDAVIKQGDQGDRFYIVDTGEYDVSHCRVVDMYMQQYGAPNSPVHRLT